MSPSGDGESAPDIYRKQVARIEELERENKRLLKENSDGEKRWKKAEDELEDLREAETGPSEEMVRLVGRSSIRLTLLINSAIRDCGITTTKRSVTSTGITYCQTRIISLHIDRRDQRVDGTTSIKIIHH